MIMKKLIALFAVVAAMFAVSCSSPTPSDAAVDIYQLIIDCKYEAAVEEFYFDSEDPAEVEQAKAMFVSLFKEKAAPQFEEKGGIVKVEALNETISEDGKSAEVELKLTYGDGTEETENVDMVCNEAGEWKASIKK